MVRNHISSRSWIVAFGLLSLLATFSCRSVLSDVSPPGDSVTAVGVPVAGAGAGGGAGAGAGGDGAETRTGTLLTDAGMGGVIAPPSKEIGPVFNCEPVGQFYCNGRALQECVEVESGTEWLTRKVCASEALCVEEPAECLQQLCASGDLRCKDNEVDGEIKTALESCGEGLDRWSPLQFCESAGHCDNVVERACRLASCQVGERRCNDGVLEQCSAERLGYDIVQTCESQALCELTQDRCALAGGCTEVPECAAPVCAAGETRCQGAEFQRCNLGRTAFDVDTTCASAELCSAGPVVQGCQPAVCAPGQHQCSGAQLEICAAGQHQFESKASCINSAHCDPVAGACGAADCQVDERRCNGRRIEVCNADQTAFVPTGEPQCASAALCRNNGNNQVFCQQPACQPNQFNCNGAQLQVCNGEQTSFVSSGQANCASPQLCSAAERRCRPPICRARFNSCDGTRLLTCLDSQAGFSLAAECQDQGGCNPTTGQCGDLCLVGQSRCNGSVVQRCNSIMEGWQNVAFCASDQLCAQGVAQGRCSAPVCTSGQIRCQGNQLQRCNAGRTGFDTIQTCRGGQTCDAAGAQCDICSPNNFSCQANQLQRCSSDGQRLQNQEVCPSADLCSAGAGRCLRCAPAGGFRCGGQNLFQCSDDQQRESQLQVCREAGLCQAGSNAGQCLECATPGQTRCDGDTVRECSGQNTEFTAQTCESVALCQDNNQGQASCDGPECQPGEFVCNGQGELRQCNNNQTGTNLVEQCATAALCNAVQGQCNDPVCTAGQSECRGSQVFTCNAERSGFSPTATCESAELCSDNGQGQASCSVAICSSGERRCQGAELQICGPGREQFIGLDSCGSEGLCETTLARGATSCDVCSGASCDGDTLVQCQNGQSNGEFACEFGCTGSSCDTCEDSDCSGTQVCFQNSCVVCTSAGGGCSGDLSQCKGGTVCVECLNDNQCSGSSVCVNDSCVECDVNSDCNDNDPCTDDSCGGNSCQTSPHCTGTESVCSSTGDCSAACDPSACGIFGCNAAGTGCNTCNAINCSADSVPGGLGACEEARCNGATLCEAVTSCNQAEQCIGGSCQEPCGPGNCNASTFPGEQCIQASCDGQQCVSDPLCGSGQLCISDSCVTQCTPEGCVGSVDLGDCQRPACNGQTCVAEDICGNGEFCDANNQCEDVCNTNTNCQGDASQCVSTQCTDDRTCVESGCQSNETCDGAGNCAVVLTCNAATCALQGNAAACTVGECSANDTCEIVSECSGGLICFDGACEADCSQNCNDNPADCTQGICVANECQQQTTCVGTQTCTVDGCQDPAVQTSTCVDTDCDTGEACNDAGECAAAAQ